MLGGGLKLNCLSVSLGCKVSVVSVVLLLWQHLIACHAHRANYIRNDQPPKKHHPHPLITTTRYSLFPIPGAGLFQTPSHNSDMPKHREEKGQIERDSQTKRGQNEERTRKRNRETRKEMLLLGWMESSCGM